MSELREILSYSLFDISGTTITVGSIVTFLMIIVASFWVSRFVQSLLQRALARSGVADEGTVSTFRRLTHYLVVIAGVATALQVIGISLTTVFAAGAVVAVGVGFALQNILQNFVSGVILLAERSITEKDVLEVGGEVIRVERIGARSTVARTRDEDQLIIPNSNLVQSTVTNYTLTDDSYRIRAKVGVSYESDMEKVEESLMRAGSEMSGRVKKRQPVVLLLDFADSSVVWEVSIWTDNPWQARTVLSNLNKAIWNALKEDGITIAYPQLDVHFPRAVVVDSADRRSTD